MKLKKTLLSAALLSTLALSYPAIAQEEAAPAEPEAWGFCPGPVWNHIGDFMIKNAFILSNLPDVQKLACRPGSAGSSHVISFRSAGGSCCGKKNESDRDKLIVAICQNDPSFQTSSCAQAIAKNNPDIGNQRAAMKFVCKYEGKDRIILAAQKFLQNISNKVSPCGKKK